MADSMVLRGKVEIVGQNGKRISTKALKSRNVSFRGAIFLDDENANGATSMKYEVTFKGVIVVEAGSEDKAEALALQEVREAVEPISTRLLTPCVVETKETETLEVMD